MGYQDDFEQFWQAYPRKIAKKEARKAFAKALEETTLGDILRAIEQYKTCKPDYQDFKHPATWLNKGCWEDEYEDPLKDHRERLEAKKSATQRAIERQISERDWKVVK